MSHSRRVLCRPAPTASWSQQAPTGASHSACRAPSHHTRSEERHPYVRQSLVAQSLIATDPDVAYFRSQYTSMTDAQKRLLQDLCQVCNYKATSILPQWLSADGREEVRAFLESNPEIKRSGRYSFTLDDRLMDFSPAMLLPDHPRGRDALGNGFMSWLTNRGWALKLLF